MGSITRLTQDKFFKECKVSPSASSGILYAPTSDNQPGPAKLLRPVGASDEELSTAYLKEQDEIDNEMRLINNTKNAEMWNKTFLEHTNKGQCDRPHVVNITRL